MKLLEHAIYFAFCIRIWLVGRSRRRLFGKIPIARIAIRSHTANVYKAPAGSLKKFIGESTRTVKIDSLLVLSVTPELIRAVKQDAAALNRARQRCMIAKVSFHQLYWKTRHAGTVLKVGGRYTNSKTLLGKDFNKPTANESIRSGNEYSIILIHDSDHLYSCRIAPMTSPMASCGDSRPRSIQLMIWQKSH